MTDGKPSEHAPRQADLFGEQLVRSYLPSGHTPIQPPHFHVDKIVLARGSTATPERDAFVRRICSVYSDAAVEERLDAPHNRIDLDLPGASERHVRGKRTLVLGALRNAVRFSEEAENTCPNYWHFSVYGFCPYGCAYCYLAGTQGVWFSPTVKVYVNLDEILAEVDRVATRLATPTSFYHGKLQDGLALDPLTAYSTALVLFFARHRFARHILLTKSASVDRLLDLPHEGHTTLSWSLNPPAVARLFEDNVPLVEARIGAMERCAKVGYPVRAVIMPIILLPGWEDEYETFLRDLLTRVPIERLTLGGICSYRHALHLMECRLGSDNAISQNLLPKSNTGDGRIRYAPESRVRAYDTMLAVVREIRPDLETALCLEEPTVWQRIHERWKLGRCNCVL